MNIIKNQHPLGSKNGISTPLEKMHKSVVGGSLVDLVYLYSVLVHLRLVRALHERKISNHLSAHHTDNNWK